MLLVLRNRSNNYELKSISELFLLFKSNKYLSYFLVIYLFSSMGIPPLLGFFNKLFILLNLMQFNMYLYVFIIVLLSCISVLYNLRLIKVMYFDFKKRKGIMVRSGDDPLVPFSTRPVAPASPAQIAAAPAWADPTPSPGFVEPIVQWGVQKGETEALRWLAHVAFGC